MNVGLVTGRSTPSARHAPRTKVVLPAPSSPETVTTSPGRRSAASPAANASVSSGEDDSSSIRGPYLEEAELHGRLRRGRDEHGLRLGLGDERAAEQLGEAPEVRLEHLEHPRRVQRRRRVVERIEKDAVAAERHFLLLPVHARDPGRPAGEQLRREVAERRDDLRPDQLDLLPEMALAGLDLVRLRIAVAGRPALYDIA